MYWLALQRWVRHSLIPVTNSLKLISESLFWSRRRNMRPASTGV